MEFGHSHGYNGPDYGPYDPFNNPFGVGFYHGWVTGRTVTTQLVLETYPDFTWEMVDSYHDGRNAGVKREWKR
jgi:hypothetical protein